MSNSLQDACQRIGIVYREVPADGRWHRTDAEGKHPKNGDGGIRLFADGDGGMVQNWTTMETPEVFFFDSGKTLTPAELAERKKLSEIRQQEAVLEETKANAKAAALATSVCNAAEDVQDNPYLSRKDVSPTGYMKQIWIDDLVKLIGYKPQAKGRELSGMVLIVPIGDSSGISSIEMIDGPGLKAALFRGKKAGKYWLTKKLPAGTGDGLVILIGEGVATVLSAVAAVPSSYGVAAFSCHNLKAVAQKMRDRFPAAKIIVLSDLGNGQAAAEDAAKCSGSLLAVPAMPEGSSGTDFNDLHQVAGLDEVARQIALAVKPDAAAAGVSTNKGATEPWPEPILFGEIQTPEIPCSLLPGWLGEYATAVAKNTQTPQGMSVMMALAVVAACVQKRFKVARTPDHIEPLSIWPATGLPPANRKTAVVNAFTGPLTAWEKEQDESLAYEQSRIATIREVTESRIKTLHAQAAKADSSTDRNRMIEEACRLKAEMPDPLTPPRIFTGDVTPERLQSLMAEHGERMALLSDEGGIFAVMAGLYNNGKANIDVFLKGHAGSAVRVDRQGRTAHLDEPALTFGLCVQPDIIRRLSETSFKGNGCLARFLFCLPASNIGTRTAHTSPVPESVKAAYQVGIQSFLNIKPVFNEHGKEQARIITLEESAEHEWEAFFDFIEYSMKPGGELEPMQDWAGKLAGAALRIAGLMTIVEQGESAKKVSGQAMINALNLCELLIPHAQAAFELMSGDDAQHDAKHIFMWIVGKGSPTFKQADIYRELRRFNDADRLNRALRILTNRHIISEPTKSGTGGRPSIFFDVNPAILGKGEA